MCELEQHKTAESTGDIRTIKLTRDARAVLEATPEDERAGQVFLNTQGQPWTRAGLRSALRRAGLNSVYRLRHTRAQSMLRQGVAIEVIAKWLGHKDLRMVLRYVEAEQQALDQAARDLASPLPPLPESKPRKANRKKSGRGGDPKDGPKKRGESGKRRAG